jgi:hypothetical protein
MPETPSTAAAPFAIDPATFVTIEYRRAGGSNSTDERARLYLDGHVELEGEGQAPVTFQLSPAEVAQLTAVFEEVDFHRNAPQADAPSSEPDASDYVYEITQKGVILRSTLLTQDGSVPDWAQPLLPLLNSVLLEPKADLQQAESDSGQADTEQAGSAPIILEFRRTGGVQGLDDRLLVHLDRGYSIARTGVVEAGQLTREEMARLLQLMEAANLKDQEKEYLPEDTCCDLITYELTYRNLMGSHSVRAMEGAVPEWLQAITDTFVDAFLDTDALAAALLEADTREGEAVRTPQSVALAEPSETITATEETAEQPRPTPVVPAQDSRAPSTAAVQTITGTVPPTSTIPAEPTATYGLADFVADLVATDADVELAIGRIVKPYLAGEGVIVRVNGQPVQAFQYTDGAILAADAATITPDGGQIGDFTPFWQAPPHFWTQGKLLVLAITEDSSLVELLSDILGTPFAGPQ